MMIFLRRLLFPLSILYNLVTSIRNLFFDIGIFRVSSFKIPILIVGNLNVGGTGKTPQIEYLIRGLQDEYNLAVLSRGYKRKTTGFILVNSSHSVADVGDEPLQYFNKFDKITVAVDADRANGIHFLIKKKNIQIILLDDAFQHRKVKGSFYILLTKYNDLFCDDFLLPAGNLRESRRGAKRADVILVTKCPKEISKDKQKTIKNKLKKYRKKVFFTAISYANKIEGESREILLSDLEGYQIVLVTGIADPMPLVHFLKNRTINFEHLRFPDHHSFSTTDIKKIKTKFNKLATSKKKILTTEKDYTRLASKIEGILCIKVETIFLNSENNVFNSMVERSIK